MTISSPPTRFTPDDLLNLASDDLFELVDGKLVEIHITPLTSKTCSRIAYRLFAWTENFHFGEIYSHQSFRCFPDDSDLVRRPDVAVIVADRLAGVPDEGHVTIAPDVAVEVVSPNDKIYELDAKLQDYRSAGVKLVWVVNPDSRTVLVHRLDHTVIQLQETGTLSGETVLPGFSVLVKDILPPK